MEEKVFKDELSEEQRLPPEKNPLPFDLLEDDGKTSDWFTLLGLSQEDAERVKRAIADVSDEFSQMEKWKPRDYFEAMLQVGRTEQERIAAAIFVSSLGKKVQEIIWQTNRMKKMTEFIGKDPLFQALRDLFQPPPAPKPEEEAKKKEDEGVVKTD